MNRMNKFKGRLKKALMKRHDKRGASEMAWMLLSIGALFMLYVPGDLTVRMILGHEINGILDNSVSAAVTQINEEFISTGEIEIDAENAEKVVYEVIGYAYDLEVVEVPQADGSVVYKFDEDGLKDSPLKKVPEIEFQVVRFNKGEIQSGLIKSSQPFSNGDIYPNIDRESVVVRVTVAYPPIFLSFMPDMEVSRISAAQAQLTAMDEGGVTP